MNQREQIRRKPIQNQVATLKQNPSATNIHQIKERKRISKSKEKENQKANKIMMPFREREVIKKTNNQRINQQHTYHPQYITEQYQSKKLINNYNFKNVKNNMKKNQSQINPKDYYYQTSQQTSHHSSSSGGISINVNIQNMVSNKKGPNSNMSQIQSQRSPSINKPQRSADKIQKKEKNAPLINKKQLIKKKKTVSHVSNIIQDFACEEELQIPAKTANSNILNQNHLANNHIHTRSGSNINRINRRNRQIVKVNDQNKIEKNPIVIQRRDIIQNPIIQNPILQNPIIQNQIVQNPVTQNPTIMNVINQLKKFDQIQLEIRAQGERQLLFYMVQRQEQQYRVNPTYINDNQKSFNPFARATMIDWMMHVCFEYNFKRDTFHIAAILVDKFFATVPNIPKSDWQLVGASTMYIAQKLQEFQPKPAESFAVSTNNRYTSDQIVAMQLKICKALKFNLNPITIFMWANRLMDNFDAYLQTNQRAKNHPLFYRNQKFFFKKFDDGSYNHFRLLMQYIDCAVLDIQTVQYPPQLLVLSFMYIIVGFKTGFFTLNKIINQFPNSSLYLAEDHQFNDFFRCFLEYSFQLSIDQLLPQIQYAADFFRLALDFRFKQESQQNQIQYKNYQDYISYQTYNRNSIVVVHSRKKNQLH